MKGCVLIPSYNEAGIISDLVSKIKKYNLDVIVIDDGSSDDTKVLAKKAGAEVIVHHKNMGKGASLRSGFQKVVKSDYDFIITMDGDGQHHPDDIKNFLSEYSSGNFDLLIGNRMDKAENMPYLRWFTNKIMSVLISSVCKRYIPDTQCGFRLIKSAVLKDIAISTSNYEIETEMLTQVSKKNYRIGAVPIRTIYEGQDSKINPVIDTMRFFRFLLKDRLKEGRMILKEFFNDVVIKQGSIIFLSSILCNIFNLAFWLFMLRKLHHVEYGILNSVVSFLAISSLPASILQTVLTRYFSEFNAQEKRESSQVLFRAFFKRVIIVDFVLIAILLASSRNITDFLHLNSPVFIYATAFSIIFTSLLVLTISTLRGLQHFPRIAFNSIFHGFMKIFTGVVLVSVGFKAFGAFLGFILSEICAFILSLFQLPKWVIKIKREDYKTYKPSIKLKSIYSYFFPVTIALISYTLFTNSDIILVKHFFSESKAGIYSIAQTVGKLILYLPGAITLVFFPVAVQRRAQNKKTLPLLRKSLLFVGALSTFAVLFTFTFPRFVLKVISGKVLPECIPLVRFIIFPMSLFSIVYIFIFYNLSLKNMRYIGQVFAISILQIVFIYLFHLSLFEVIGSLFLCSVLAFYLGLKSISWND